MKFPELLKKYYTFMDGLFEKVYAQRVLDENLGREDGKVWYLPHHSASHPQKPEKVRIVFDRAAKYQGVSLNDRVLKGPDLTNSLAGVLLRFREEPVAMMSSPCTTRSESTQMMSMPCGSCGSQTTTSAESQKRTRC